MSASSPGGTMIDPLSRLAIRYGTDKFGPHDYTPRYHALLHHLRDRPVRLLEIGVGGYGDPEQGGASLCAWRDYFPHGHILGLDIEEKRLELGPRITLVQGSQVDPEVIADLVKRYGPFDVIVDDGSHLNAHVVESFGLLAGTLRPGGFYIVEDVQTAFFPEFGGSLSLNPPNSVAFFANLCGELVAGGPGAEGVRRMWRFHNVVAVQMQGGVPGEAAHSRNCAAGDLPQALDVAENGIRLRVQNLNVLPAWLCELFVEIDHREIKVHHPDAVVMDQARQVTILEAARSEVVLERGQNDYPSNFAFDVDQPEARVVLDQVRDELNRAPSEPGYQVLGGLAQKADWEEGLAYVAARLREMEAQEVRSIKLILRAEAKTENVGQQKELLSRAAELHPGVAVFAIRLSDVLMAEGNMEGAEAALLRVIAAGTESGGVRGKLARLYLRLRRFDEARAEAEAATRISPRQSIGWHALARVNLLLGRAEIADAVCDHALEQCGGEPGILILQAQARLARGKRDAAAQSLDRAAARTPDHPKIAALRARIKAG